MSRETFMYLCDQLSFTLNTVMRNSLSVEMRATPTEYRTIGHLFGIARSTVCEIVHETCPAIVNRLIGTFPRGEKLDCGVEGFLTKWRVPQCVGAIESSHNTNICPV